MTDVRPVEELTYEQAREELASIVQALETGSAPLEETLKLWKRGEHLARRCQHILTTAQNAVDQAMKSDQEAEASA